MVRTAAHATRLLGGATLPPLHPHPASAAASELQPCSTSRFGLRPRAADVPQPPSQGWQLTPAASAAFCAQTRRGQVGEGGGVLDGRFCAAPKQPEVSKDNSQLAWQTLAPSTLTAAVTVTWAEAGARVRLGGGGVSASGGGKAAGRLSRPSRSSVQRCPRLLG